MTKTLFKRPNMKKASILILLVLIFSCAKDDSPAPIVVDSITPANTFISDTLTLVGQNLSRITRIAAYNDNRDFGIMGTQVSTFISQTDTELKFVMPESYHEDVTFYINGDPVGDVNLFGYIPYSSSSSFDNPIPEINRVLQIVNSDLVFMRQLGGGLLKVTDKLNTFEGLPFIANMSIVGCHFFNATTGYIYAVNESELRVYYTQDGGTTFSLEHSINQDALGNGSLDLSIDYFTENLGYFIKPGGSLFRINENGIENIHNVYPELSTLPNNDGRYEGFKLLDDGSLLLYNNGYQTGEQTLFIRIDGTGVTLIPTPDNDIIREIKFFDNIGYYTTSGKIVESTDYGQTWNDIYTHEPQSNFDYWIFKILGPNRFLKTQYYQGLSCCHAQYQISNDNAQTWSNCYFNKYENVGFLKLDHGIGLADGHYRYFKFIDFP